MAVPKRSADPWFEEDVKKILGDTKGVLRFQPSRAELEAIKELSGLLWGYSGSDSPGGAELQSELAGYLHTPKRERIEIRFAPWGGQALEYLPWPKRAPRCRLWILKLADTEYLIAMTQEAGIPEGRFPELNDRIGPRTQRLFPGSYVEQRI